MYNEIQSTPKSQTIKFTSEKIFPIDIPLYDCSEAWTDFTTVEHVTMISL